ncbi:Retrovirus-related Pol polyprotein from transposon TNT 1-94 [Vitis vinifera]|uniref:Retrovirus-related Pol polyprotein from transposon TNT 1-94 n=1 Tax=Vitis vinifera TaxID=29760 RepID=A0A438HBX7_VITVI|nr:Retrovirus-related Pol polyprotein from transposon TNT 1-94 [Vitis vinifera]
MATHLKLLTTTVYDGVSGVRDHIIKLRHYFNKANEMKVELGEKFLKWLILESLPVSFDAVKLTYNALKEEWTLEELMSIVVQHEVSLKKNETHSLALVTDQVSNMKKKPPHKNFGGFKQFKRKGNSNQGTSNASASSNAAKSEKFKGKCNFCHKIGHKQADCFKFKNWLEKKKKGEIVVVVNLNANMIETNIVDVHANSWWLDTGATIHVTNSLQEMTNRRKSSKHEECVYMGDGSKVKVEFFGMIKLKLIIESFLLLHNVAFIPSLRRNLISVSSLDRHGYSFHFGGGKVDIFCNSVLIGNGVLFGNLYSLSLHHGLLCDSSSVNSVVGCKRARMNLSSSMLWHKRLGEDDTKTRKEKIDRCGSTLDLIHTDICGPLSPTALGGYKYFITFIDDFSRFGYVELIHEKSDSLNVFKAFKAKVELQLGKPIKAVKSDRGASIMGDMMRLDGILDHLLSFCWNVALMRDIQCQHSSTEWGCRKEESHIVRYVPSKSVPKTPYELWSGKKPSLHHFHVWGCKAEVRPYNPQSKKLDPKTISGFFVGYCIGSRDTFWRKHVVIPFPTSHVPNMDVPIVQQPATNQGEHGDQVESDLPVDDTVVNEVPLRISQRVRRPAISDDYMVYLQEHEYDEAMDDEMNSMYMNGVWDLVELPHGCKPVGCKWVFKTKRDSSGKIERYKARLVVKGYSQREGIDFKETFSPVSTKDSFRVIMAIVAHFDLELHQMDVKTAFLNGDLDEEVYMEQPTGFVEVGKEDLVCKLNKSIYGLKQASRQWYLKFDKIITQNGFKENTVDRCIYLRGDKFSKAQCPQNDDEREEMRTIPYSSVVGSLMYAQVCTRPDIAFVVGMLGRYLSNPGSQHWKAAKKVLRYLQGTKDLMLTYQRTSLLDVVGFCDADFAGCIDDKKSTTGYIFMMAGELYLGKVSSRHLQHPQLWRQSMWHVMRLVVMLSVAFSKNTRSISRSKHIDVKFYFVKEKVAESLIDIEHMSTKKHSRQHTHTLHFGLNFGRQGKSSLIAHPRSITHPESRLLIKGSRNGFPKHEPRTVEFNQLSGVLPPELGNLPSIERILLCSNNFTGELPQTFAGFTTLKDFGPIPSGIALLTKITDLRISDLNGTAATFHH